MFYARIGGRPRQPALRRVLEEVGLAATGRGTGQRARLSQIRRPLVVQTPRWRRMATMAATATKTKYQTTPAPATPMRTATTTTSTAPNAPSAPSAPTTPLPDLDRVAALVQGAWRRLLDQPGTPTEPETAKALQICREAAELIMDEAVQPQLNSMDHQADTAASALLGMEGRRKKEAAASPATPPAHPRLRDVVSQISDAAYAIVTDARVALSPTLLAQYVDIQARLGRPASLPHIFDVYASSGRRRMPPVDTAVADEALTAAMAARDLDAAVGVVETTYAAPAFVRDKVLRQGLLPAFAVVGVPVATYALAVQLATMQTMLDTTSATAMAFAAILAYIGFTGAIGAVANATANDQMRRVTWAPGTPLRQRWLREAEREALDRVTCAFGFSEAHRFGEEESAEFEALREYVMRKGMLIDQTEMLEGMSS